MRKKITLLFIFIIFVICIINLPNFNAQTIKIPKIYQKIVVYNMEKQIKKIKEEKLYTKTNDIMYITEAANLRNGPSNEHETIIILPVNSCVQRIAVGENGWSKILYDNKTYYINSKYLSFKQVEIEFKYASEFIKTNGDIDGHLVELADQQWYKIPENIRNSLKENGWQIVITSSDLATMFGFSGSIAGITSFSEKTIYLENRNNAIKNALIHEVGHAVDAINDYPSRNKDFIDIYYAESSLFVDSTATGDGHESLNPIEYFASVFSETIINETNCETTAPNAYRYIQNYIN